MSEHTKGPWEVDEWGQINGPDGRTIVANGFASVLASGDWQDVARANGRLAAAAPELLEALQWMVDNDETNEGDPDNQYWIDGLNRARQAISKATNPQHKAKA